MPYDTDISDTVSLSKILDCMVWEGEEPHVILDFLKMYEPPVTWEVINESLVGHRILELDFLGRCGHSEVMKLYSILLDIVYACGPSRMVTMFVWKILTSDVDSGTKGLFRKVIEKDTQFFKHPYTGHIGKMMRDFENPLSSVKCTPESMADYLNSVGYNKIGWYFKNLDYSLFYERVLEDDLFCLLHFGIQYVMISTLCNKRRIGYRFIMSVLPKKIDPDLKMMLYDSFRVRGVHGDASYYATDTNVINIINGSETYPQLMMNVNLFGAEGMLKDIIPALLFSKPEMMVEMYRENPELIRDNYDICELIEKIVESGEKKNV